MRLKLGGQLEFGGRPFGALRQVRGEVVFNTGMVGYVETLTDPSYRGQILVATYPLQGNYGVPEGPFESERVQVAGLVVQRHAGAPSHRCSERTLGEWLAASGVPAIEGVDTRALTQVLREQGTMRGELVLEEGEGDGPSAGVDETAMGDVVSLVTARRVVRVEGSGPRILVIDTGAKENIVRSLCGRGAAVVRVPFDHPWEEMLGEIDGVMLTNGPGDPKDLGGLVRRLKGLLEGDRPVFGICLGHQLLALAAGADTYKLKYGHRSHNQPVLNLSSRRAYVTSQNHGYAVDGESLPRDWEPSFVNLNDGTNEGIRHRFKPFYSVQFHPEAAAGPRDAAYLFDDFLRVAGELKRARMGGS